MSWKNTIRLMVVAIALMGIGALSGVASAQVGIGISVGFAPPEIPVYEQPICPGDGYIWTPGYWAWDDDSQDYYWVPGTWLMAPEVGYLWTPGYWGWGGSAFFFHEGYWGPQIGFYGGINYGFGYFGRGYEGGRWEGGHFFYNREVNRVDDREIRNVYSTRIDVRNESRVSFNGGNGGINERATAQEEAAARDRHVGMVGAQQEHVQAARGNPELRASANHGRPPIAATSKPGAFSGGGVVAARSGGNYNPPANRGPQNTERTNAQRNSGANNPNRPPNAGSGGSANNRATYNHSSEVPQHSAPQADANANQKYQQQQEKLIQKQNQEHQQLQQKQAQEHQRATQQRAPAPKQQQMEQRHQQQTQQMEQKHTQQQQKIQQRQAPPPQQSESKPHKP
jgi:WXXGXW repeat (2 copies)